jgi:hypothetical protein
MMEALNKRTKDEVMMREDKGLSKEGGGYSIRNIGCIRASEGL